MQFHTLNESNHTYFGIKKRGKKNINTSDGAQNKNMLVFYTNRMNVPLPGKSTIVVLRTNNRLAQVLKQ